MQRLFSAFPAGWPGAGLLLLRSAAGLGMITIGAAYSLSGASEAWATWMGGATAAVSGVTLIVGLLTPAAALLVSLTSVVIALSWIPVPSVHALEDPVSMSLLAIVATSVLFLGPGAYSVDSYLFGRRELVIPQERRTR